MTTRRKVMENDVSLQEKTPTSQLLVDLRNTQQLCELLLKEQHYAKMGHAGIFAIVETAKSLGVDPRLALGGGLYYVKGKVEMSARMMNALIRAKKHSVTRDKKSNDQICILHGKRSDTTDTWTESFSIEEAEKAGLLTNAVWRTYPRDMLFARALSRLARQLFPDIIGNCYVEGEISLAADINQKVDDRCDKEPNQVEPIQGPITEEQAEKISTLLEEQAHRRKSLCNFMRSHWGVEDFSEITTTQADWIIEKLEMGAPQPEHEEVSA